MVKIWEIETIELQIKKIMSYRFDLVIELFDVAIAVIINYYIWSAFKSNVNVLGYVLTIASMIAVSHRKVIDDIFMKYRSGSITFDLIRPKRFSSIILFRWIGSILSNEILVIPIILLAFLFNPSILFFISIFISFYLKFLIGFIASSLFYETYYSWGVGSLIDIITYATGGGIPFFLMPEIIKKLMLFNPLFYMMAAPWVIQYNPIVIVYQIICLVSLMVLASYLERRMLRKLTTVGV